MRSARSGAPLRLRVVLAADVSALVLASSIEEPGTMWSLERAKHVLRTYGRAGAVTYLAVSTSVTAGFYVAIENHVDVKKWVGIKGELIALPLSTLALAFFSSAARVAIWGEAEGGIRRRLAERQNEIVWLRQLKRKTRPLQHAAVPSHRVNTALLNPNPTPNTDDDPDAEPSRLQKLLLGPGSHLLLAVMCSKALIPLKLPVAVALTPYVHRLEQRLLRRAAQQAGRGEP